MARRTIHLRTGRIETLTGMRIAPSRTQGLLAALGFEPGAAADGFEVVVPRHRQDVGAEADLVEEVARSAGYDAIPETIPHLPERVVGLCVIRSRTSSCRSGWAAVANTTSRLALIKL